MSYNYQEWALWCKLNLNTWNTLFTVETYLCYLQMRCSLLLCLLLFKSAAHNSVFLQVLVIGCVRVMRSVVWKRRWPFLDLWPVYSSKLEGVGDKVPLWESDIAAAGFVDGLYISGGFYFYFFYVWKMSHYIDLIGFIAIQAEASLEESQGSWTVLVCHITSLFQLQTKENLFPLACEGRL